MDRLTDRFGIDDRNLALRREFVRLGDAERRTLLDVLPWFESHAAEIARAFYDWQFTFGPTRAFFERYAASRKLPIADLRRALERTQAEYVVTAVAGARDNWNVAYFERRLQVGAIHDRINLPFKWYIGSYCEFTQILHRLLREAFPPEQAEAIELAVGKVFNLDMQAISDSFLLNTFESMGLDVAGIKRTPGTDCTDHVAQIKAAIDTLRDQAAALANDALKDKVLDQRVGGQLGQGFGRMVENVRKIAAELDTLATGDLRASADAHGTSGVMHGSLDRLRGTLSKFAAELKQLIERASAGEFAARADAAGMTGVFGEMVNGVNRVLDVVLGLIQDSTHVVVGESDALRDIGEQLGESAQAMADEAASAARTADQVSSDVQSVAAAADEMTSSIESIARHAMDAAQVATSASQAAMKTSETVNQLGTTSTEIGKTISDIGVIARQTNLLALNAAIEAARAGDAGRGFAVVAHEVKKLSTQTARASDDIGRRIRSIQVEVREAVDAIGNVSRIVQKISESTSMIAAGVEEHNAATAEIARGVRNAATGTSELARYANAVATAARTTTDGAQDSCRAAEQLAQLAAELEELVGHA